MLDKFIIFPKVNEEKLSFLMIIYQFYHLIGLGLIVAQNSFDKLTYDQ